MIKRQKSLQTGNLLGIEKLFVVYHLFNSRDVSGTSQRHDLIPGTHNLSSQPVHCKTEAQGPAYITGLQS